MDLSVAGHFGEWLQGRLGSDGPVVLVTLACPALRVRVGGSAGQAVFPDRVLRAFCRDLGLPEAPLPALTCDMPPGGGSGASTATLVALARALGFDGSPERLAEACLRAEGASDPLMFDAPDRLLWASREGRAVANLSPPPACEIVGGFWGAPRRTDPEDADFADVSDLVEGWRGAVARRALADCARLASRSAARHAARRGADDPMPELARALGALGHVAAHTGSARGLIFAPGMAPPGSAARLEAAGLTQVLRFATGGMA